MPFTATIRAAFAGVCLLSVAAGSSLAQSIPQRTALPGVWGPNGDVIDSVTVGDTLFVGGAFDYIGPPTESFAAADAADGRAVTAPAVGTLGPLDYTVGAASDGAGGWFVATIRIPYQVAGTVAHVLPDGRRDPAFSAPAFSGGTLAGVTAVGGRPYVFGDFRNVNGVSRHGIAALDPASGAVLPWDAALTLPSGVSGAGVRHVVSDGGLLYLAGYIDAAAGQPRRGFAVVDAATAALQPATFAAVRGPDVFHMAAADGRLYIVGGCVPTPTTYQVICGFSSDGTLLPGWLGRDGAQYFGPLVATPTRVYVAATPPGAFPNIQHRIRGFDPLTGAPDGWQSPAIGVFTAQVTTMAAAGGQLFVSGGFDNIGGIPRARYAAFDEASAALQPWAPAIGSSALRLVADGARVAIVGKFRSAGGRTATNLAAIDLRTGGPASIPLPPMTAPVRALTASGSLVVAGAGPNIVAFSATTGTELARFALSAPGQPPATVQALAIAEPLLFVGGNFLDVLGQPRQHLAALDMRTGQPTAFNPRPNGPVFRLRVSSGSVFAVGGFNAVPGYGRAGVAAWDVTTGVLETFSPQPLQAVVDVAFFRDRVALVGAVDATQARGSAWAGRVTGDPVTFGRPVPFVGLTAARTGDTIVVAGHPSPGWRTAGVVALDAVTGDTLPWTPVLDAPVAFASVTHVQATPGYVVLAGSFATVDGAPAHNLAIYPMTRVSAPRQMTATLAGATVTLGWQAGAGPAPDSYQVEVGSASGATDVGTFDVGRLTRVSGSLPAGTFYARVRGISTRGAGAPGSEVILTVPSVPAPPQAPGPLTANVANGVVTLSWGAAAGNATTYVVEAGTASGLSNVGALPLGHLDTTFTTPAPPGTYFVRVRAANAFGVSAATSEVTVVVP